MPADDILKYKLCNSLCTDIWECAGFRPLSEIVHGNHSVPVAVVSPWQVNNVDSPPVKWCCDWYGVQRLRADRWVAALTDVAGFHIVANVAVHLGPPEV